MTRTAFVSTYPPRQCSVAKYTHNLAAAIGGREIVALYGADDPPPPPVEVHHRIRRDEPDDYARTARSLAACADVVAIQHDFDIWGGEAGRSVLDFVGALEVPAIATLHSVPAAPDGQQRLVLAELVKAVAATVVMSRSAATLLHDVYGVDRRRIEVIPHGTPDLPLVDSATVKPAVGMTGREVILSFGLVGPEKGWEAMISALPAIVKARPSATYVMLGATHPDVGRRDGEAYRESLVALAARLGMTDHVLFVDRFVGRVELTRWLEASDLIVVPALDLTRSSAGTLAYAMATGRAVVSASTAHAAEVLADGRGVIVPPGGPASLAASVTELLADVDRRAAIGRRAHEYSRPMTWWHTAARYRNLLDRVVASPLRSRPTVHGISPSA